MDVKVIREQDGWRLVLHRYRLSLEQHPPSDAARMALTHAD